MRDGDPPFYGQPHRRRRPRREPEQSSTTLDVLKPLIKAIEDIMGLIIRTIAGISITKITDEVIVFPVEIADMDTVLVKMLPTPTTQVGERYVVQLKLDMGDTVVTLPFGSIILAQADVDSGNAFTIPFDVSDHDLNGIKGYIAEVFLDAAIADIGIDGVNGTLTNGVTHGEIVMNVGGGGLAGFDIELTISDPLIAKFVGAFFPPSFPLSNTVPDPVDGAVVRIRGVDLADVVNAGAFQEVLATLDIQPLSIGISTITARIVALDNEAGFPIQSVINNGSITVTA